MGTRGGGALVGFLPMRCAVHGPNLLPLVGSARGSALLTALTSRSDLARERFLLQFHQHTTSRRTYEAFSFAVSLLDVQRTLPTTLSLYSPLFAWGCTRFILGFRPRSPATIPQGFQCRVADEVFKLFAPRMDRVGGDHLVGNRWLPVPLWGCAPLFAVQPQHSMGIQPPASTGWAIYIVIFLRG